MIYRMAVNFHLDDMTVLIEEMQGEHSDVDWEGFKENLDMKHEIYGNRMWVFVEVDDATLSSGGVP